MKLKTLLVFLIFPAAIIYTGCTSMDKEYLQDENNYSKLDPLKLEPAFEAFDLRIDIGRRTKREESAGMEGNQAMTVEYAYTPIGFDIGNGVFIDSNFNICLDILELYDIAREEDFTIVQKPASPLIPRKTYHKEGDKFELTVGGVDKINVEFEEEQVSISRRPGGNSAIVWEDNTLRIEPVGVLKAIETHTISGSENEYKIQIPLKKLFITLGGDEITFAKHMTVRHDGYTMFFTFEDGSEFRFIRIGDDYYFFNEVVSGFHIAREGNVFTVTKETRKMYDVELLAGE